MEQKKQNQLDLQMTGREKKIQKAGVKMSEEEIAVLKNVAGKSLTDTQFVYFVKLSESLGLNPFNKEAWAYQDQKGNLITMAGRDGFLKIAQRSDRWNGIFSCEVRKDDEFSIQFQDGKTLINHKKTANTSEILGAYAYCKPKDIEVPTIEYVNFADYNKGQFTWKSHPADMIKKVAEVHCLKKAHGITGLQSSYDFEQNGNHVKAVQTEQSDFDKKRQQVINKLANLEKNGYKMDEWREELQEKQKAGELTEKYLDEFLERLNENEPKK